MRASPDGFVHTVDAYPVVLFGASPRGEVLWVNRRWHEMTGVPPDAILALAWQQMLHADDARAATAAWMHAMECGEPYSYDARIRYADGTFHWVHTHAEAQRNDAGEITGWTGAIVEIDDLKTVERELVKSELRFRALTDNVAQIIFVADERWHVTYLNRRYFEYTGVRAEDAYGEGWRQALPASDLSFVEHELRAADASGSLSNEHMLYHAASGTYRWNLIEAERVADASGSNAQWFGTITDIHDRKISLEKKNEALDAFQIALLPREVAAIPGCDLSTLYVSASEEARVGGDWYDVFELGKGRYGLSIGDVVGHGLEASAAMSRIRQYISAVAEETPEPSMVLRRTNTFILRRKLPIATAIFAIFDVANRRLIMSSAGHPSPIIVEGGRTELATCEGIALGVSASSYYKHCVIDLSHAELLVLYTDGAIEFSRDLIAAERQLLVAAAVTARLRNPASRAAQIVRRTMGSHAATDDVAMIALRFGESGRGTVSHRVGSLMSWQFQSDDADSAYRVRDQALQFLRELARPDQELFEIKAVLGELVANAAEHAPGQVHLEVDWSDERALLRMRDHGPGFVPRAALPGDVMSESGRGLYLIAALADDLRAASHFEGGTEVSVRLRLHKNPAE